MGRRRTDDRSRKDFLNRLRLAMENAGISQNELAKKVGQSSQGVSDWFTRNSLPGGEILMRLPAALGVSGSWLLDGTGTMVPSNDAGAGAAFEMGGRAAFVAMRTALDEAEAQWSRKAPKQRGGRGGRG